MDKKPCELTGQLFYAKDDCNCDAQFCKAHGRYKVCCVGEKCTKHKEGQHLTREEVK